jgi:hypothetical protein
MRAVISIKYFPKSISTGRSKSNVPFIFVDWIANPPTHVWTTKKNGLDFVLESVSRYLPDLKRELLSSIQKFQLQKAEIMCVWLANQPQAQDEGVLRARSACVSPQRLRVFSNRQGCGSSIVRSSHLWWDAERRAGLPPCASMAIGNGGKGWAEIEGLWACKAFLRLKTHLLGTDKLSRTLPWEASAAGPT